ncbi:MAG: HEAT repeat domain-containing protein [Candidatus Hydrogenedentes bacterium]|nr:HEAT repeat domain-containing protein [Candidatus Hydrogenedentota bacterium]
MSRLIIAILFHLGQLDATLPPAESPEGRAETGEVETPALKVPPETPSAKAEKSSLDNTLRRVLDMAAYQAAELHSHSLLPSAAVPEAAPSPMLRQMAQSPDPQVRLRAVEAWIVAPTSGALDALLAVLTDEAVEVRAAAANGLASFDAAAVFDAVLQLMMEQDPALMAVAPEVLPLLAGQLGSQFLALLEDAGASPLEQMASAYALGLMRHDGAAAALTRGVWSQDVALSRTCALALGRLQGATPPEGWMKLARHPDPEVAVLAMDNLKGVPSERVFLFLCGMARGELRQEETLQVRALMAIRDWPGAVSVPALIEIMGHNPRVASVAGKMLEEITGVALGPVPQLWQDWWHKQTQPPPMPLVPTAGTQTPTAP